MTTWNEEMLAKINPRKDAYKWLSIHRNIVEERAAAELEKAATAPWVYDGKPHFARNVFDFSAERSGGYTPKALVGEVAAALYPYYERVCGWRICANSNGVGRVVRQYAKMEFPPIRKEAQQAAVQNLYTIERDLYEMCLRACLWYFKGMGKLAISNESEDKIVEMFAAGQCGELPSVEAWSGVKYAENMAHNAEMIFSHLDFTARLFDVGTKFWKEHDAKQVGEL